VLDCPGRDLDNHMDAPARTIKHCRPGRAHPNIVTEQQGGWNRQTDLTNPPMTTNDTTTILLPMQMLSPLGIYRSFLHFAERKSCQRSTAELPPCPVAMEPYRLPLSLSQTENSRT